LISVLCLSVCRLCVPNVINLGACFKKFHLVNVGACLLRQNLRYFRCLVWKTKSWQKSKPTWKM